MLFDELTAIFGKPKVYEHSNSTELWNNPHISKQMLALHLDPDADPASRNRKFMDESIAWLAAKAGINSRSRILDLGCGPGLYTAEFAAKGAKVTGIDVSENSIGYAVKTAREKALDIEYVNGDYVVVDFPGQYDLVTIIYDDYCVLKPGDRRTLLKKVLHALGDDGLFVFDVLSRNYFDETPEKQSCTHHESGGFWYPEEHFVFEQIVKYEDEKVILQKNTVIGKGDSFTICNYLKCFETDEILRELSENGFRTLEYFSDISGRAYDGHSKEIALVNKKLS